MAALTTTSSNNTIENRGTGFLLVLFPDDQNQKPPAILSPTSSSSPTPNSSRRANSSHIFAKAQLTISICVLFLLFTLILFTLSTFEPTIPVPPAAKFPRRFLSQKRPDLPILNSLWLLRIRDFRSQNVNPANSFALQRMGTLYRRGTRAMHDLLVAHIVEDITDDELRLFLRLLHRSGVTAKADLVLIFGSSSWASRFSPVIEQENDSFLELVERYGENRSTGRDPVCRFDSTQFVKSGNNDAEEPLWGRRPRTNYSEPEGGEDESTGLTYGSILGFEANELDPENSLAGFLDQVPMSLRRWACYPMLLGRLKRNFKHIMLIDMKKLLILDDPLSRVRNRSPESVYLFRAYEKRSMDKTRRDNNPVSSALLMGGVTGIRRLSKAMLTEIVRAAMQGGNKGYVSESATLSRLVGTSLISNSVDLVMSAERIQEPGLLGSDGLTVMMVIKKRICACEIDSSVYRDC